MTHLDDVTLSAWIEGDLPDDKRLRVDEHLRDCAHCRDTVATLREMIARFREPPPPWTGKQAAWNGVAERIHDDGLVIRTRWLAAAGTLAAAAVAAVLLWTPGSSPRSQAQEPAVVALLAADELATRDLDAADRRDDWSSPGMRQAITAANAEVGQGVAALREALRQDPNDPVLTDLLRRAVQHRVDLAAEVVR